MKYRENKDKFLKKLYEQPGLGKTLTIPSDYRFHYLSIVFCPPLDFSQKLIRDSLDWMRGWDERTYYIQRVDTIHLTLVDVGGINNFKRPIKDIIANIDNHIESIKDKLTITFTEPKIGSSGINLEIKFNNEMNKFLEALYEIVDNDNIKGLEKRSVSLVRFLIPEDNFKNLIKKSVLEIEKIELEYNRQVDINELLLVRTDKVADYFQILYIFNL